MTFSLSEAQAWVALLVACMTVIAHVASTAWVVKQARKMAAELHDRDAVQRRALSLIRELAEERRKGEARDLGDGWFAPNGVAGFQVGEDPLRDRAIMLAQEWGALHVEWNLDHQVVGVRKLKGIPGD